MFCPNPHCRDSVESGVHADYPDGTVQCPRCGAPLVGKLRPNRAARNVGSQESRGPWLVVATFNYRHDADMAASYLQAHGIVTAESADDCGGVDPGLGFATRARVMVPQADAAKADALLKARKTTPG